MKIAFFGTPEFAGNILESLLKFSEIEIFLVVSQPDKAIGRKKELQATATKKIALENGIEILQPDSLKISSQHLSPTLSYEESEQITHCDSQKKIHEKLKSLELDFIVVVAYGKIIPESILSIPKYGCINLHGSLLPQYRGASPVQASIKAGDRETGLTTMYMSKGMDEGDILQIQKVAIESDDTSEDIFKKFSEIGPELLLKTLTGIVSGELKGIPQNHDTVTYCSKISREDGEIFFTKQTASDIYNTYRAYTPWPGIYTWYEGKRLVLEEVILYETPLSNFPLPGERASYNLDKKIEASSLLSGENGERCLEDKELSLGSFLKLTKNRYGIVCSNGEILEILQVKLEGKKSMDTASFVNGNKEILDYIFI